MLGALAGHPIEFANGHRELTADRAAREAIERYQILHGAFAEGALAEDDAPAIILDGAREDLGGGGAEAIHQHRERTVVSDAWFRVVQHFQATCRVLQLHDRTAIYEEARERGGFRQVPAAVAPQV